MGLWLCPSMMCADFGNMQREIETLDDCGIDYYHLDVMDGQFVRNFGLGLQDISYICKTAKSKTEVHLMIKDPQDHIEKFLELGVNRIFFHPEADYHPGRVLQTITLGGAEAGLVLSPGTSIESVMDMLPITDVVMVMMVNPGFAGQGYLPYVERKLERLIKLKDEFGFEIILDGACSYDVIKRFYKRGVKGFVLGTAALFREDHGPYRGTIEKLRKLEIEND